jgi:hypothetical protein
MPVGDAAGGALHIGIEHHHAIAEFVGSNDEEAAQLAATEHAQRGGGRIIASTFYGAEAYVAAALHAVETDLVEHLVGALLCRLDVVAQRGDAEHAAAGRDHFALAGAVPAWNTWLSSVRAGRPWITSPLRGVSG